MRKVLLFLYALMSIVSISKGETITGLTGVFKHGQVFLTWKNVSDTSAYYKVYRSTTAITKGSMLPACEYLGETNSYSSQDFTLTRHDGVSRYFHIDSLGAPLDSMKGLFVATTLVAANYYYAVTIFHTSEDTSITFGFNSLNSPIVETVMIPAPVYQETRLEEEDLLPYDIYTTFHSTRFAVGQPLENKAGFIASDFALFRNSAAGKHPLVIKFHSGGVDFISNITGTDADEINISLEDNLPDDETTAWWGANENFDVFNESNNDSPPNSGIDYAYTLQRITMAIDWAISHLSIDTNRIYMEGTSFGAPGAYFYTITFPDRIAATKLSVGIFNFSFQTDYQPTCSMNTGKKNRKEGNQRFGTIANNFMTNLNYHIYDLLNGGWVIHNFNNKSYPVIYSVNGKRDDILGWTEKPIYYDSINTNHMGGYYFWDNRDHAGNGKTWDGSNFNLLRYRKNLSFPAFANCSLNEDYGTGNGAIGLEYGSVNGALDWNNNVTENSLNWEAKIFVRNLIKADSGIVTYPDSCTVDITPRRTQKFNLLAGDSVSWTVKHNNQVIQSGLKIYNGGALVISGIKVFRDTSVIHLNIKKSSIKNSDLSDQDGFDILNNMSSISSSPDIAHFLQSSENKLADISESSTNNQKSDEDTKVQSEFVIYPNPNDGLFFIKIKGSSGSDGFIEIFNCLGVKLYEEKIFLGATELIRQLDLPQANTGGIYMIRLTMNDSSHTSRLTIY